MASRNSTDHHATLTYLLYCLLSQVGVMRDLWPKQYGSL